MEEEKEELVSLQLYAPFTQHITGGTSSHVICFHPPGPLGFGRTLPKIHLFLRS